MSNINPITKTAPVTVLPSSASARQTAGFSNTMNQKLKVPASLDSIFEEASRKYQVPVSLLKAVGKAESDFNPKAVSSAGAQGVMQLMPATAKSLGVNHPFDPYENIMGGAKYLSQMLDRYHGDTKLALAAYNAGCNNVDKYDGIPPFKETQNYVVKVMKYAGSDLTMPSRTNQDTSNSYSNQSPYSVSGDDSAYYKNILQNVLDFDSFSSDDYLLFLELIKSNLQVPGVDSSFDLSDNLYQQALFNGRIQTLY